MPGAEHHLGSAIHLTPPELAQEITDYVSSIVSPEELPIHFGDPAIGTGAFYLALLKAFPKDAIASAIGIDVSYEQVRAARSRLAKYPIQIVHGDFLHMDQLPQRNLILANPPYLRHQGIRKKYKEELRQRTSTKLGIRVSGRSGLYLYFMILSHEWMAPNAIGVWLIPSEFMQTSYGMSLRYYLTHRVELLRVHQFGHDRPQFENAEVLPAVVVFRNRMAKPQGEVQMTSGGTLHLPATRESIPVIALRGARTWAIPTRSRIVPSSSLLISDLFKVTRGIATGANDFFILERSEATGEGIPKRFLKPILPKVRTLTGDIIEANADGFPKLSTQLCLLDCDLPEDELQQQFPMLFEYFQTMKSSGILKHYLISHRSPWYKQEHRDPPPFLCTYMGRERNGVPPLRFLWNKSQAVATNTYLLLYPRQPLAEVLRKNPGRTADLFDLLRTTAIDTMSEHSRIHAGGLRKIEPSELGSVRIAQNPAWLSSQLGSQLRFDSPDSSTP